MHSSVVRLASTFAGGGRWIMLNTFMRIDTLQWASMCPLKSALPVGDLNLHLIHGSLDPHELAPQTASWSVQPSFEQLTCVPNRNWQTDTRRHTDHAPCDICSSRPHLCTACRRCGLKIICRIVRIVLISINKVYVDVAVVYFLSVILCAGWAASETVTLCWYRGRLRLQRSRSS